MSNWTKDYKESQEVRRSYRRDSAQIQFIHRSLHTGKVCDRMHLLFS